MKNFNWKYQSLNKIHVVSGIRFGCICQVEFVLKKRIANINQIANGVPEIDTPLNECVSLV